MQIFKPSNPDHPASGRRPRPGSFADRMGVVAGQRPPPPKGRGVALVVIGLALCYALFHTFVLGGGPGKRVRDEVAERELEPQLANEGPTGVETPPVGPQKDPTWSVPEGLAQDVSEPLAAAARALEGQDRSAALQGLQRLPLLSKSAPEKARPAVRAFLADRLAEAVVAGGLRREAIDAAIELQLSPQEARNLLAVVPGFGLADDAATPSALLFLESYDDRGGPDAVQAIEALVLNSKRPLPLRVLAAKARPRKEPSADLKRLLEDPATPPALKNALR